MTASVADLAAALAVAEAEIERLRAELAYVVSQSGSGFARGTIRQAPAGPRTLPPVYEVLDI